MIVSCVSCVSNINLEHVLYYFFVMRADDICIAHTHTTTPIHQEMGQGHIVQGQALTRKCKQWGCTCKDSQVISICYMLVSRKGVESFVQHQGQGKATRVHASRQPVS